MKEILKSKSFIKLAALTVLNALYIAKLPFIMMFVGLLVAEVIPTDIVAIPGMIILCMSVPLFLAMLAVDRIKWWLISLSIQFVLDIGMMYTPLSFFYPDISFNINSLLAMINYALIILVGQAIGVGIKVLWHRHRRR